MGAFNVLESNLSIPIACTINYQLPIAPSLSGGGQALPYPIPISIRSTHPPNHRPYRINHPYPIPTYPIPIRQRTTLHVPPSDVPTAPRSSARPTRIRGVHCPLCRSSYVLAPSATCSWLLMIVRSCAEDRRALARLYGGSLGPYSIVRLIAYTGNQPINRAVYPGDSCTLPRSPRLYGWQNWILARSLSSSIASIIGINSGIGFQ